MNSIPNNLKELFSLKEHSYEFYAEEEMDNVESMRYFLESVGVSEAMSVFDDGTYVEIFLRDYYYKIVLTSSGLGDPFSHLIESDFMYLDVC
jgi:hypothetical protein